MTTLGERFVRALAAKDFAGVAAVLHPQVDFRGMTPGRFWEATGPDQVIEQVLKEWFEDQDRIDTLVELEVGGFGDRDRVGWRFAVTTTDGPHLVEQQAFYSATGEQIGWMRVMCSGFRPAAPG